MESKRAAQDEQLMQRLDKFQTWTQGALLFRVHVTLTQFFRVLQQVSCCFGAWAYARMISESAGYTGRLEECLDQARLLDQELTLGLPPMTLDMGDDGETKNKQRKAPKSNMKTTCPKISIGFGAKQ